MSKNNFKAGYASATIEVFEGDHLEGYYFERVYEGALDPLEAFCIAFDDGEKKALLFSLDVIGIHMEQMDILRNAISHATGVDANAMMICCTHTHLAPCTSTGLNEGAPQDKIGEFLSALGKTLVKIANEAILDLKPASMYYANGKAENVSFVRIYKMKDGTYKTNPGFQNPDIVEPITKPDERVGLLLLKRENAPEISIINFQVHPDVISGNMISADYPRFVRETFESVIQNSKCVYINGAQGDSNHIDVTLGPDELRGGYERSRHMGRVIACGALSVYALARKLEKSNIRYFHKEVELQYNKGQKEELAEAHRQYNLWKEGRDDEIWPIDDMYRTTLTAKAKRIVNLENRPDKVALPLSGIAVGDFVIVGYPGEPFTKLGTEARRLSKFTETFASCCCNGYEDYFPTANIYDLGGYEAASAHFKKGESEKLIDRMVQFISEIYE